MHDLKMIRQDPEAFDAEMARRGAMPSILPTAEKAREALAHQQEAERLQREANENAAAVGKAKVKGDPADDLIAIGRKLGEQQEMAHSQAMNIGFFVNESLALYPNFLAPDVPPGRDEADNVVLKTVIDYAVLRPNGLTAPREHFDIGEVLGLDFEGGVKITGSRFTVFRGDIARLARALGQFMLDLHIEHHGYAEVMPPVIVNRDSLYGTGQFPKFETDVFQIDREWFLAPTSEVMLTNLYRDTMTDLADLPVRMAALTECFRLEAGSAGRDTRGIIRQHQFQKVELVSIVAPDKSAEEHERMTNCAENVLRKLALPFRRMLLCAGDTGFSARKTYDLEVWMPGAGKWREISSCSNCGDFQARRMAARVKLDKKTKVFAHTLNGSGVAVGRALAAILENHQQPDGSVWIPEPLRAYMGGVTSIG